LTLYQALGYSQGVAFAHFDLGNVACRQRDAASARSHFDAALALAGALGPGHERAVMRLTAQVQWGMGWAARLEGDSQAMRTHRAEALRILHGGCGGDLSYHLSHIGDMARDEEEYEQARALYRECLILDRDAGDSSAIVGALVSHAVLAGRQGDPG